jgi:steroid delta-isomerase
MSERTIRAYAASFHSRDRDAWLASFADEATQEDPVGSPIRRGRDEIAAFFDDTMASYAEIEIVPREIYVLGNEGVMVWTINGIRVDGRVSFDGVDVFTFDGDRRITSVRAYWERAKMRVDKRTTDT